MTKFSFIAVRQNGETVTSEIEANDRLSAINSIKSQDLKLISLKDANVVKPGTINFSFGGK